MSYRKDADKIYNKIDKIAKMGSDGIFDYCIYIDQIIDNSQYTILEDVLDVRYGIDIKKYPSVFIMKKDTFKKIRYFTNSTSQEKLSLLKKNKNVYSVGYHFFDLNSNTYLGDIVEVEQPQNWIAYKDPSLAEKQDQIRVINIEASVGLSSSIYQSIPNFDINLEINYKEGYMTTYMYNIYTCIEDYDWYRNIAITPTYSTFWQKMSSPTYSLNLIDDDDILLVDKYSQAIDWIRSYTYSINIVESDPIVITDGYDANFDGTADIAFTISSDGGSLLTDCGICWSININPTINDNFVSNNIIDIGSYTITQDFIDFLFQLVYVRPYATNSIGTSYGDNVSFEPQICLVEGTKISLSDNTYLNIEDISYDNDVLVWNFDDGRFDTSNPLWIKEAENSNKYNLLTFSDGSTLKTINQHRIFNIQKGKFTPAMTDDTPIGTNTFNNKKEIIRLVDKKVVYENVKYYNLITKYHMNMFANGILTSCRYNNIYPINNMKFDKTNIKCIEDTSIYAPKKYIDGLRLNEQDINIQETKLYIDRLLRHEKVHSL